MIALFFPVDLFLTTESNTFETWINKVHFSITYTYFNFNSSLLMDSRYLISGLYNVEYVRHVSSYIN